MTSRISAWFIAVQPEKLDDAIKTALKVIGDFEGVFETSIEIFQSKRIKNAASYSVVNARGIADERQRPVKENASPAAADPFETISVPITIGSETAGHFRFLQELYRDDTLEKDVDLIRLIGEIIINAILRKQGLLDIRLNENRLASTIQVLNEGVITTNPDGLITLMNQMAEHLTGWEFEEAENKPLAEVFRIEKSVETSVTAAYAELQPLSQTDGSLVLVSRDGRKYDVKVNRSPINHQQILHGEVTVFRDITREKSQNDQIRRVSYHDSLTGLYNRTFFEEILNRLNTPRQYPISLIMGDCNDLKEANDQYGHLVGDRLLQNIARILKQATRHEDIVARWGGDEFTIILPKTDEEGCIQVRERILALTAAAPAEPVKTSLALGCATNTEESLIQNDMHELLQLAEQRMYEDKRKRNRNGNNR